VRHWRLILLDRSLFPATRIVAPVVATSLVSTSRSKPTALRAVSFQQVLPLLPRPSPHRTIAMSHAPMLAAVLADGGLYVRA
jgi:hypothetical protein